MLLNTTFNIPNQWLYVFDANQQNYYSKVSSTTLVGYLTSDKKVISTTITLPKRVDNLTNIQVTQFVCNIRHADGGYLLGGYISGGKSIFDYTASYDTNHANTSTQLGLTFTLTTAESNFTNNCPLAIDLTNFRRTFDNLAAAFKTHKEIIKYK